MENISKSVKKTNKQQFEKMLKLMEANPDLAKGLGSFGSSKKTNKEMWDQFAIELNSLGPPTRDGKGWNKVWLDYKLKLKKKIATNRRETVATGGGPYTQLSLSPLEQSVDALLSLQSAVSPNGVCFGGSTGLEPSAATEVMEIEFEGAHEAETANNKEVAATPRRRGHSSAQTINEREKEQLDLLKKQSTGQEEILKIAKNIEQNLRDIARYKRKSLEIKKETLQILKEKEKRKKAENDEKARRHKEKLKIKIRKLELKELKYKKTT